MVGEALNLWSNVRLDEQVPQIRIWYDLAIDTAFATDAGLNLLLFIACRKILAGIADAENSSEHNTLVSDCFVCGSRFAVQLRNRPLAIILQMTPHHVC